MDPSTYNSIGLLVLSALLAAAMGFLAKMFWNAKEGRKEKADELRQAVDDKAEVLRHAAAGKAEELAKANEKMATHVRDLQRQIDTLTATFTPISAAFQAVLIKQLTHFHTPEMDHLLELGAKNALSNEETKRLSVMLLERATDLNGRIDDSEREAALMLPMVMNRVRKGATVSDSEVMVVLVPKEMASKL